MADQDSINGSAFHFSPREMAMEYIHCYALALMKLIMKIADEREKHDANAKYESDTTNQVICAQEADTSRCNTMKSVTHIHTHTHDRKSENQLHCDCGAPFICHKNAHFVLHIERIDKRTPQNKKRIAKTWRQRRRRRRKFVSFDEEWNKLNKLTLKRQHIGNGNSSTSTSRWHNEL